uniref:Ig-like domain-containing protein n=1 Tax=Sparus aurata TaxID=8175 RepID=A0A671VDH4_SPAAU
MNRGSRSLRGAHEGEQVTLRCYYKTAGGQVEALRWEKNGVTVLEVNLSTGEITNGTGFEGKRLSPAGATEGDFSLTWDQAQLQDEGDYFCSVRSKGVRMGWGDPAAARLKVIKKHLDPTTPRPPQNVSLTAHSRPAPCLTCSVSVSWCPTSSECDVLFVSSLWLIREPLEKGWRLGPLSSLQQL